MTKRLCDICGKEITKPENEYNISIDSSFMRAKYLTVITDVCSDCANSIYHYIEGLKRPLSKSIEE
uniref:Uncharacterized protein n=1 Tax=Siphoviridae sp. ctKcB20 TaxID=2827568 RepID=A0A8S5LLG2_9CAUD|nr:MAG TPA: protein of unknown function DUF4428 [Siphoviridae sp. ctKcB20]